MKRREAVAVALAAATVVGAVAWRSCSGNRSDGGGALRSRKVVLKREVEGLKALAASLERKEPLIPAGDAVVVVREGLAQDLVAAQLPFEVDVDGYHVRLLRAEVMFRGSPAVELSGTINLAAQPDVAGAVTVLGALDRVAIDQATGTLRAAVSVDHIDIQSAAGLEAVFGGAALDEVARQVRLELAAKLPALQIPVRVDQSIAIKPLQDGAVRIDGATLPLQVAVSRVWASQGELWVGVSVKPGQFVKTGAAPKP